jgi:hypothetical protein
MPVKRRAANLSKIEIGEARDLVSADEQSMACGSHGRSYLTFNHGYHDDAHGRELTYIQHGQLAVARLSEHFDHLIDALRLPTSLPPPWFPVLCGSGRCSRTCVGTTRISRRRRVFIVRRTVDLIGHRI